jgi:hypothetical protein
MHEGICILITKDWNHYCKTTVAVSGENRVVSVYNRRRAKNGCDASFFCV